MNELLKATKAIRQANDARILHDSPVQTQTAEEIVADIENQFAPMIARDNEKRQRCRDYLATLAQSDTCPVHNVERDISFDESWATSLDIARRARHEGPSDGTFYAEYVCPVCERAEKFKHWTKLRIPEKYFGASLDDLHYETQKCREFLQVCRRYQGSPAGFLLLFGTVGNGKTHAACAILGARGRGIFFKQSDLINGHRKTYANDGAEDVREKAIRTPLLVLDELGVAVGGNDAATLLFDVLDTRYGAKRPTILTSNLPREELLRALGPRLIDRIEEACFAVLRFDEASKRKRSNAQYLDWI